MRELLARIRTFWAGGGLRKEAPACHPVKLVFERFRRVLHFNNLALEVIADMGEMLGGAFLFDRQSIRGAADRLATLVRSSIEALNELDDNRHRDLFPVYDRLTSHLQDILTGREEREGPALLPLSAIQPRHWGLVGGKFARLAEVRRDGHSRIPDGFVITSRTYHDLIDTNGLGEAIPRFEALMARPDAEETELENWRGRLEEAIRKATPPPGFTEAVTRQLARMGETGGPLFLAVRSSAAVEDMELSFAGLFRSVLNVPAEPEPVFQAYREVVASLFGSQPVHYQRKLLPGEGSMAIAVGCQRLVEAEVSGVAYSVDPLAPAVPVVIITAAWGQGEVVVEGAVPTDSFRLEKAPPFRLLASQVACKKTGRYPVPSGGLEERPIRDAAQECPCLSTAQLAEIAAGVLHLENLTKRPVDVEWAIDRLGRLSILQARPLLVREAEAGARALSTLLDTYEPLTSGQGKIAQQGIGAGPVFIVSSPEDLQRFPEGAVLVGRRDSSSFARVMDRAAAIVTEIGTPVSHMATLCRELRVPCLVGVPGILAKVTPGMEVTVDAEDRRIYQGRVPELTAYQTASLNLAASKEFRLLRRMVKTVSGLHLLDPLFQEFSPQDCQTYHDLLRYTHEMAVLKLVEVGRDERCLLRDHLARPINLPIPAGILVIDIDGGLTPGAPDQVEFAHVASVPFRAILQGMLYPEVWHRDTMPVGFKDLVSSMLRVQPDEVAQYSGHNIAVISRDYVNLCFRFGYHFNIIDAHCHDVERDNHIYFRFLGGATDLTKRSRRARLIASVLEALDFNVRVKGDLVIARAGNMIRSEMERTLDLLGRLVGFTRQLDVRLDSDAKIDHYVKAFLLGNYK